MPHRVLIALLVVASLATFAPMASAGQLLSKTFSAKSHAGSRDRQYRVFVPSSYVEHEPVPLLMIVHGCKQTDQNMLDETRFSELAEQYGFIGVYPFITSYDGQRSENCWGFWFPEHIHQGGGEVEDLYLIAREVEAEFRIDPERRYVTGLSSGGAMAVALAVARSEYFAAAGAAAGLPYSETAAAVGFSCFLPAIFKPVGADVAAMREEQRAPPEQRQVPLMVVQSSHDCTVHELAALNLRDSWLRRYGAAEEPIATRDCSHEGVACAHEKYGSPERSIVETVIYDGARGDARGRGTHYWVGDGQGEFANPTGPSASELFWEFFARHPFSESAAPPSEPEVALATWFDHISAQRIRSYPGAPCRSGFGVCDAAFTAILFSHPMSPVPLYRAPDTNDWYLDPAGLRPAP